MEEEKKERRGRKKKIKEPKIKEKKKRGRKATSKFYSSMIRKNLPTLMEENENDFKKNETEMIDTILHINIDKSKIIKDFETDIKDITTFNPSNYNNLEKWFDNTVLSIKTKMNTDYNEESNLNDLYYKKCQERKEQDIIIKNEINNINKEYNGKEYNDYYGGNKINKTENTIPEFINILKDFETNKDWVHTTNIKCWWCCHNFQNVPLGIPMKLKKDVFFVKGCFCSFNCMLSYVKDNIKYKEFIQNIRFMMCKLTNKKITDNINCAPPRECLDIFGGEMNIEMFRKISNDSDQIVVYKRVNYPMKLVFEQVENNYNKNIKNIIKPKIKLEKIVINEQFIEEAKTKINKENQMKTPISNLYRFLGL